MSQKRRMFSPQFKAEAVQFVIEAGRPISVIAKELETPVTFVPCLVRVRTETDVETITLGHPLRDNYLAFVGARARPNTWLAVAFDLKVFFLVITKDPVDVTPADVFTFLKEQRSPRRGVKVVGYVEGHLGEGCSASPETLGAWSQVAVDVRDDCHLHGRRVSGPVAGGTMRGAS